ncbi:hypothetical protein QAD02_017592 [Eretmocerus hayati]|uniref:Uncharacterized protein n=1 Tax=Eretmocerus hayati TaxID=131215 RepID=A0ACC2PEE6_9HYME|nr:hypothetical protein QAD02_017592 [Eretmocerus hayati]
MISLKPAQDTSKIVTFDDLVNLHKFDFPLTDYGDFLDLDSQIERNHKDLKTNLMNYISSATNSKIDAKDNVNSILKKFVHTSVLILHTARKPAHEPSATKTADKNDDSNDEKMPETEINQSSKTHSSSKFCVKHNLKAVRKSSEVQTCQNSPSSGADDGSEKVVCQNQDSDCSMCDLEGRRIIRLKTLGKNLFCIKCESILPLVDATSEKRIGLASALHVKCRKCSHITAVGTDEMHRTSQQIVHYDVNFKTVMGTLNAGMVYKHGDELNKVGKVTEVVARESCDATALEERRLTIESADKLKVLLPSHLDLKFIFPGASEEGIVNENITANMVVRVPASFDVGCFTRGSSRSYNSLSGTGTLIGYFSGKVIGYAVLNRMCSKCDRGHSPDDHDCRLNFVGSAKAMEPEAAIRVTRDNESLKKCNIEVGIIIADNDSTAILAAREVCSHEIVKQSDKNHTSKGLVNALHKIKGNHKELSNATIDYLKKCFNYCISQNQGNIESMTQAIQNIPHHAFNHHDHCGEWRGFKKNPGNYVHSNIGDGLFDEQLFNALRNIFDDLSRKTCQFVAGASSNTNESMNHSIVTYASKSRCYAKSPSGDRRVACAISKKNEGEKHILDVYKILELSPGLHTKRFVQRVDFCAQARFQNSE